MSRHQGKAEDFPTREKEESGSRAPAVTRAARMLKVIAEKGSPISLNEICGKLGVIPGSAHHILRALEAEQFVRFNDRDKRYSLGPGVIALARQALEIAVGDAPIMDELQAIVREFRISCCATRIIPDDRIMILQSAPSQSAYGLRFPVGRTFDAFAGATGRCYAAASGRRRSELKRVFKDIPWSRAPDFETWLEQVELAKANGYGVDLGQYLKGFNNLAAPIFHDGELKGTLLTSVASRQLEPEVWERLKGRMREAAQRLSR